SVHARAGGEEHEDDRDDRHGTDRDADGERQDLADALTHGRGSYENFGPQRVMDRRRGEGIRSGAPRRPRIRCSSRPPGSNLAPWPTARSRHASRSTTPTSGSSRGSNRMAVAPTRDSLKRSGSPRRPYASESGAWST